MAEETHLSSSTDRGDRGRGNAAALDFALARLARRAHSEGELTVKMERADYAPDEIQSTLAKLRAWRYVDDRAYALAFARSAVDHKHWGPARVARALRERRVSEPLIEEAVAGAYPQGEALVLEAALERFRRAHQRRGTPKQRKARAYRHLLGRGFSPAAIMEALNDQSFIRENDT